jgi:hypothetical protein
MKIHANKLPQRDSFALKVKGQRYSGSKMFCLTKMLPKSAG